MRSGLTNLLFVALACRFMSHACLADEVPFEIPPTRPAATHPLRIEVDAKATVSRLQIPRGILEKAQKIEQGNSGLLRPLRTIIAGLTMSIAAVGLLFWRLGGRGARLALAALATSGILTAASVSLADKAAPPPLVDRESQPADTAASPRVILEILERGDEITVFVSPKAWAAVAANAHPTSPQASD